MQVGESIMVFGGCDGLGMLKSTYLFNEKKQAFEGHAQLKKPDFFQVNGQCLHQDGKIVIAGYFAYHSYDQLMKQFDIIE